MPPPPRRDPSQGRGVGRAPTQELPDDVDEAVQAELGNRSPEELYGEAVPQDDSVRPRSGPPVGEKTRVGQLSDLDEQADRRDEPQPDATFAGPPVKIEVLGGPDEGNVKRFRGVRMVIGRGKGCDLELTDQSVSRRHIELVYGEKGVLLRDLNSTTGSKVNGERIAERILAHLDEIQIGRTKLRFVDEMVILREREAAAEKERLEREAAEKAEAEARAKEEAERAEEAHVPEEAPPPPNLPKAFLPIYSRYHKLTPLQQRAAILGAVALVVFLPLVLFVVLHHGGPPPPTADELLAHKKYQLAHTAMDDGRFDDAVALIEGAEKAIPGIDSDNLLAQAKTDLAAKTSLDLAQQLLGQQRFEDARAELARTPQGTDDQQRRHDELLSQLDDQQNQFLTHGAQMAIQQGNFETAKQIISALPKQLQPALRAQLEDAENHHEAAALLAEKHQKEAKAEAEKRERSEKQARFEKVFGPVAHKLDSGDYDRARLECDRAAEKGDKEMRAKAREIKMLIPIFQREYEDGLRKAAAGSPELSVRPLRKAKKLYEEIGLPGSLGHKIDHALALAALAAAKTALGRDDYESAVLSYKEALSLEPSNAEAKTGMTQLIKKTDQMLLDAYVIRDRDPRGSIDKLKLVMEIAPQGSPNYEKAKSQLSLLQP